MSAVVLRGDAAHLPLPDASVDLIVTSPPYWGQRSYTDAGQHYDGQIGSEGTPGEFIAALLRCTQEWMRVLKDTGSIFVDLGDKFDSGTTTARINPGTVKDGQGQGWNQGTPRVSVGRPKSLLMLPERYRIACADELGLIVREVIEWDKPNPIPESARDRCGRTHEDVVHLVKQPRYFAATDEIREPPSGYQRPNNADRGMRGAPDGIKRRTFADTCNPLGKVPGSVWTIPSQPLIVPDWLGIDHFAAFPMELPRRIILGWSPSGICLECGEGRQPVATVANIEDRKGRKQRIVDFSLDAAHGPDGRGGERWKQTVRIVGYACACTPYTDHPERRGKDFHATTDRARQGMNDGNGGERYRRYAEELANPRGPVREYDFAKWTPPPTSPAVVVDPFSGTGTTPMVASVLGRIGIGIDRSMDYCRLAQWRTNDPGERARALGVPKPPKQVDGQADLFEGMAG